MQEYEKSIFGLILTGAFVALGKLLVSKEGITFRIVVGRAILGSATSLLAGLVLIQIPHIHPLALLSLGSGLGIVGQQVIERALRVKVIAALKKRSSK